MQKLYRNCGAGNNAMLRTLLIGKTSRISDDSVPSFAEITDRTRVNHRERVMLEILMAHTPLLGLTADVVISLFTGGLPVVTRAESPLLPVRRLRNKGTVMHFTSRLRREEYLELRRRKGRDLNF